MAAEVDEYYKPSDDEPFMNDRQREYFRSKLLVWKDEILKEHPWIAKSLSDAFERAKNAWLADLKAGKGDTPNDNKYRNLMKIVGDDPLPYGMEANIRSIEALEKIAANQRLIPRRMSISELFVDPAKA